MRSLISLVIIVLLLAGGVYAWRSSPGYSVSQIKQALETHDYNLFSRYVDIDQVLEHTLDEFSKNPTDGLSEHSVGGLLDKLLRKGVAKLLLGEAREVTKAAFSIVIEQAVKDPQRQPPNLPLFASLGAWLIAKRDGDTAQLDFEVKNKPIQIAMQRTPEGIWRIVTISNLQVFFPKLENQILRNRARPE
ncbi:MAG: hypothetical protein AB7G75_27295 [Candidatus Binatia bacterium]